MRSGLGGAWSEEGCEQGWPSSALRVLRSGLLVGHREEIAAWWLEIMAHLHGNH